MSRLHVTLSPDHQRFVVYGGAPGGRDAVHQCMKRWVGWKRNVKPGHTPDLIGAVAGIPCSIYTAPVNAVTAGALGSYKHGVSWAVNAQVEAQSCLHHLKVAKRALERKDKFTTPSERPALAHQAQAVKSIQALGGRALLSDDMGLGKSSVAIWSAWSHGSARLLVICPASVKFNWAREARACLTDPWVEVIDGTPKERINICRDIRHRIRETLGRDPVGLNDGVVIINYDLLQTMVTFGKDGVIPHEEMEVLRDWVTGAGLVCDESYYLKNRKSKRWRIVHEFFAPKEGGADFRLMMSGTPVRDKVDDLWAQAELIRPGMWTSYSDFCNRYLDMVRKQVGQGPTKRVFMDVKGAKNLDSLRVTMNTTQLGRKKEEVLDLPPKVVTYPELMLEGTHLKAYKAMKEWALLELEGMDQDANVFSVQTTGAAQVAMRCEQLAQGFIGGVPEAIADKIPLRGAHKIKGRPRELVYPESPKFAWLLETIEALWDQGCRPVVMSRFNAPLLYLRQRYEEDSFILHGGQTAKTKEAVVSSFQDGDRSLLLVQVKIAEGWTVTSSQDMLFHSRDWSPAVNSQAQARLHRIGQKGTVNVQIPIVKNTVERKIHERLAQKESDAEGATAPLTVRELMGWL